MSAATEEAFFDAEFDRLMDATQTLIQLKPGDMLTEQMIADLHLVDKDHRESFERATDAFHRGYESGLERGAGANTAKLIEERDEARNRAMVANSVRNAGEHWEFIKGAQVCREMMARFVEQGGNPVIANSIRLNWRPTWGADPGSPDEEVYQNAKPTEIGRKQQNDANARQIAALYDGCNALLGLVQLLLGRDDLTDELREVLSTNHRITEAAEAVAKAEGEQ